MEPPGGDDPLWPVADTATSAGELLQDDVGRPHWLTFQFDPRNLWRLEGTEAPRLRSQATWCGATTLAGSAVKPSGISNARNVHL